MEPTPDQKTTPATGTPSPRKEYGAAQIQVLEGLEAVRKRLDFNVLLHEAKKRGDSKKLIEKYSLKNNSLFARALSEAKLLNFFPDLEKSKAPLLTTFKIRRELDLFMKTSDIKAMPVRSLRKAIKEWKSTLSKNPRILLSEEQERILYLELNILKNRKIIYSGFMIYLANSLYLSLSLICTKITNMPPIHLLLSRTPYLIIIMAYFIKMEGSRLMKKF